MSDERSTPVDAGLDAEELYRLQAKADAAENKSDSRQDRVRVLGLVLILLAGALILLLRGCPAPANVRSGDGDRGIEPAAGKSALQGSVSVWIGGGRSLSGVLEKAHVSSLGSISLGKGRYVVQVQPGTESLAAKRIKAVTGVVDAGLVYDDGALKPSDVEN